MAAVRRPAPAVPSRSVQGWKAAFALVAITGAGVFMAYRVTRTSDMPASELAILAENQNAPNVPPPRSFDEEAAAAPVRHEFCGIPIIGGTLTLVMDNSPAMLAFSEGLATITQSVWTAAEPRFARMGVAVSAAHTPLTLPPTSDLEAGIIGARSTLLAGVPTPEPNLAGAVLAAGASRPDQMVLAIARTPSDAELDAVAQRAAQSGAQVDVLLLGAVSDADVARFQSRLGGRVTTLSEADFRSLVSLHEQLMTASKLKVEKQTFP